MLGVDRAAELLRTTAQSCRSYSELPNAKAFFTDGDPAVEKVFCKDKSGVHPADLIVSKHEGAWTLKLSKWNAVRGTGLEHSRVSCARARQEDFTLTGSAQIHW